MKYKYINTAAGLLFAVTFFILAYPADAATFKFIVISDAHTDASALSMLSSKAKALNPAVALNCGDLENDGVNNAEMNQYLSGWSGANMLGATFSVRGNHDDYISGSLSLWDTYFDFASVAAAVGASNFQSMPGYNDAVYSFDYMNSHFIGLDTPGSVGTLTTQIINWLDTDLGQAEARGLTHAFIYFHGPIYCFGGSHCDCTSRSCYENTSAVNSIVSVINKHPIVTATFHGHEHMYAYTKIDNTRIASVANPFYQFVSGSVGGNSRDCNSNRCEYQAPKSPGFVLVTVENSKVTAEWYENGDGPALNTMSFQKSGSTPTPAPTPTPIPGKRGDLNGDGKVDVIDLGILLSNWGSASRPPADLNQDGRVDAIDLGIQLSNWGS